MRAFTLFAAALFFFGCDGPVGLVDSEGGVRAETTRDGLVVENQKDEPVYVEVYGEALLRVVDPAPQTMENPGQRIGEGDRVTFRFSSDGPIRADDEYYLVEFITIKGEGEDRQIAERRELELER